MYDDDYDESNEWNEWINVWMRWLVASSVSSSFNKMKIIRENDNFVVRSTMFFFLLSSIFHFLTEFLSEFWKKNNFSSIISHFSQLFYLFFPLDIWFPIPFNSTAMFIKMMIWWCGCMWYIKMTHYKKLVENERLKKKIMIIM